MRSHSHLLLQSDRTSQIATSFKPVAASIVKIEFKNREIFMAREGETHRKIFESQFGKPVRAQAWNAIALQMKEAQMPFTVENLKFVAKCKRIANYHRVKSPVLKNVITAAAQLGEEAYGFQILQCVFRLKPGLTRDKFYRAFRTSGIPFKQSFQFKIPELGEVLYKIFVER